MHFYQPVKSVSETQGVLWTYPSFSKMWMELLWMVALRVQEIDCSRQPSRIFPSEETAS